MTTLRDVLGQVCACSACQATAGAVLDPPMPAVPDTLTRDAPESEVDAILRAATAKLTARLVLERLEENRRVQALLKRARKLMGQADGPSAMTTPAKGEQSAYEAGLMKGYRAGLVSALLIARSLVPPGGAPCAAAEIAANIKKQLDQHDADH